MLPMVLSLRTENASDSSNIILAVFVYSVVLTWYSDRKLLSLSACNMDTWALNEASETPSVLLWTG